jgi:hypothetical protein
MSPLCETYPSIADLNCADVEMFALRLHLQEYSPSVKPRHSTFASWCGELKKNLGEQFVSDDAGSRISWEGHGLQ